MTPDQARDIAVKALVFLADRDEAGAFLNAGGLAAEDLRDRAGDPVFLGFLMDFFLSDETLLMAFCDAEGLPYDAPARIRAALPGGDAPDWT